MKRIIVLIISMLSVFNCTDSSTINIEDLNGYWEIEHVALSNGKTFNYTFNKTIDYFNLTDSISGFRKKMTPNFIGNYQASKDSEQFTVTHINDSIFLSYKTLLTQRKECILFLNDQQLKVINQNKDVFLYKRFTSIQID